MLGSMPSGDDLGPLQPYPWMTVGSRSLPGSPAEPLRRCVALGIDMVIATVVIVGPLTALDRILGAASLEGVWLPAAAVWFLGFVLLYSPLSVSRWGATVGKRLLGMEVVRDADGGRLSYGAALVRHLTNVVMNTVPVLLIAHATVARLSEKKQGMHDRLVDSRVVMRGR